jgi:hypothetical protein
MDYVQVKRLRTRQAVAMNIFTVAAAWVLILVVNYFPFTLRQLLVFLGVVGIIPAIVSFIQLRYSRSFIPILSEVAQYEKVKMGSEWVKQQKVTVVFNLVFSVFLFFVAFSTPSSGEYMRWSIKEMAGLTGFILLTINVSLFFRMRKVDRSMSPDDFKGYTLRSNILAVLAGIGLGVLMVIFVVISVVKEAT